MKKNLNFNSQQTKYPHTKTKKKEIESKKRDYDMLFVEFSIYYM